jgi:segregation and condensation protein A
MDKVEETSTDASEPNDATAANTAEAGAPGGDGAVVAAAESDGVSSGGDAALSDGGAAKKDEPVVLNVAGASPEIVMESGDSGEELKLYLGDFAGPLDLLLYLIRQEQVDIYDIPIARITDEYLSHLRVMREMDIAVASEFLVMAAQLIEIKSKMLLPPDPLAAAEEQEEDPRRELVERLLEHQKYKAASQMLWSRATVERAIYSRAPIETDKSNPEVAVGVFDLLRVFQEILARKKEEVLLEIERDEVTMADMLERLRNMILSAGELNLRTFFERARSRRELVLAFLSVLELVRTTEIRLVQRETFGDIIARAGA